MDAPKITKTESAFFLVCGVEINIQATPHRIWKILTDAPGYPRWNSTVAGIEGEIREGGKIRVSVPDTDRTFAPVVSDFVVNQRMTWTGGFAPLFKGVRTFELRPRDDGSTDFKMQESFSGLMLPVIKGSFPDFGKVFASFAGDLKREAERTML
jgi:hypothetical protein